MNRTFSTPRPKPPPPPPGRPGSQRMKKSEDTSVEKSPKARRVPTKTGFKLRVALPTSQAVKGNGAVTTHARREWGASGDMKPWLPRRSPLEELSGYPTLSQTVNRILLIAGPFPTLLRPGFGNAYFWLDSGNFGSLHNADWIYQ